MPSTKNYHKLLIWQRSHQLVKLIYIKTKSFPKNEMFGLTSQLRRAAVSVAANIVEGQAKNYRKEFFRFLDISNGSLTEVEYYLELALDLGYLTENDYNEIETLRREAGYLLYKFMNSLRHTQ